MKEYKVIILSDEKKIETCISAFAKQGWCVVSNTYMPPHGDNTNGNFIIILEKDVK
jgi:hypothetical protein